MGVGRTFLVQHAHLGPKGDPKTFFAESLEPGQGPFPGQLGQVFEKDGKFFRLVRIDGADAVNYIDGGVAYWKDKANYQVTADASDGEALANGVAGGTHKVVTIANVSDGYIFIQVGGDQNAVVSDGSVGIGDHLYGHASTDNQIQNTSAGSASLNKRVGTALSTHGTRTSDNGASVSNAVKVRWDIGALL